MYVEILLGLCQKGSFEIDFFFNFTKSVSIDVNCFGIHTYTPPMSIHSYKKKLKMSPAFFGIRCKIKCQNRPKRAEEPWQVYEEKATI